MKLSLQQHIYFFTFSNCLFFIMLVISILWSIKVVDLAVERETYAHKVEDQSLTLKYFISSEKIYANDYNNENWLGLDNDFNELLKLKPNLTEQQQTIQNSIESQNRNVLRLFKAITENKLKNASDAIRKHLRIRLLTQLEAIQSDAVQLSTIVKQDIRRVIKHQVIFILTVLALSLFTVFYGSFRLSKIFRTSLNEVKNAFEENHSGKFQKIQLSNQSEEFISIANAFNDMNKKLSETTVSLAAMKKIVADRTRLLEELSKTDPLTNVANRRALFERGSYEFSRVKRTQSRLAVILLDCDLFKNINDEFGHVFGDSTLKHICNICTHEIRTIDFFARYGGEEFIILLPESDLDGAVETAKRIQRSLANNTISFEEQEVCVTVSIGISICNASNAYANFEQLINNADTAMYKAKEKGRNRIEVIGDF